MKKYVWKMQVELTGWSSEKWEVHTAATTIDEALDRAYVAAWRAKRWRRTQCTATFVERLDLRVFV